MLPFRPNPIANAVSSAMRAAGTKPASHFVRPPAAAPAPVPTAAPRALYELALTSAALGDDAGAIAALRQATAARPDFAAAWRELAAALRRTGNPEGAAQAAASHQACPPDDPDSRQTPAPIPPARIEAGERLWRQRLEGTAADATAMLLREALARDPLDAVALRQLAEPTLKGGSPFEAGAMAARALDLAPDYEAARHLLARALFEQNRNIQAIAECRRLLAQSPGNTAYTILLGSCMARTGDFAEALRLYESVLKDAPTHLHLALSIANALKSAGRREDCERAFRRALTLSPSSGDALWGLHNLSTAAPEAAELDRLRELLADATMPKQNRFHLHYTLAYALEKAGAYEESFAHYDAGAKVRRATLGYRPEDVTGRTQRTRAVFSPAFLAAREGAGCADRSPIFILGMPRAGSTLIEQILASHSAVEGTQELPELSHIADELGREIGCRARFPQGIESCAVAEFAALGERYLDRCRAYRRTDKPLFIDKMPGNWVNAGLIHLILPNARIIDARREPMANCFGAFKKYFAVGQDFTYDLRHVGLYYRDYRALMAHFGQVLPGRIHDVQYEDLVSDIETEVRRLLAYCGLAFEPACLRFWETERAVSTASSQQVRRPLYREALDHWRHYEPWLGPLREALGDGGAIA